MEYIKAKQGKAKQGNKMDAMIEIAQDRDFLTSQ